MKKGTESTTWSVIMVIIILLVSGGVILAIFSESSGEAADRIGDEVGSIGSDMDGDRINDRLDKCPCQSGLREEGGCPVNCASTTRCCFDAHPSARESCMWKQVLKDYSESDYQYADRCVRRAEEHLITEEDSAVPTLPTADEPLSEPYCENPDAPFTHAIVFTNDPWGNVYFRIQEQDSVWCRCEGTLDTCTNEDLVEGIGRTLEEVKSGERATIKKLVPCKNLPCEVEITGPHYNKIISTSADVNYKTYVGKTTGEWYRCTVGPADCTNSKADLVPRFQGQSATAVWNTVSSETGVGYELKTIKCDTLPCT